VRNRPSSGHPSKERLSSRKALNAPLAHIPPYRPDERFEVIAVNLDNRLVKAEVFDWNLFVVRDLFEYDTELAARQDGMREKRRQKENGRKGVKKIRSFDRSQRSKRTTNDALGISTPLLGNDLANDG